MSCAKVLGTLVFSPKQNGFKPVIYSIYFAVVC